jgi:CRISPR system Cascade subunit CasD
MQGVLFEIRAPLVSWAEGGAVRRTTDVVPSWSAIVGLLGAALGLPRDDVRLVSLSQDYALAVRVDAAGQRLEDYHTVQSPDAARARGARVQTRADELDTGDVNTTITRREYIADARYTVLILSKVTTPAVDAKKLAAALCRPAFPLYAGRRSCLVGRVGAQVVHGTLAELLRDATHWDRSLPAPREPSLVRERRDQLVGPRRYAIRLECVA